MRETENRKGSAKDTQGARHKEGVLASSDRVGGVVLDDGEDVCADKGADFTEGSSDTVVLTAYGGSACFGGTKADVVAGAEFTKCKENSTRC